MGLSPETAWNRLKPPETAEPETAWNRLKPQPETAWNRRGDLSNVSNEVTETAWNRLKPPETAESETAEDLIPSSAYRIKQYVGGAGLGLTPTALGPKP